MCLGCGNAHQMQDVGKGEDTRISNAKKMTANATPVYVTVLVRMLLERIWEDALLP